VTRGLGAFGEAWAAGYLSRLGYRVIDRNVRNQHGEIDIVARDGDALVFVEVKTRRTSRFGAPQESITPARYARLARCVEAYLQRLATPPERYRIDVVAIEVGPSGRVESHELLQGVEAPG
jgi:putative endonuclease